MSKKFGFDLLRSQLLDRVHAEIDGLTHVYEHAGRGDTPIERLLFGALATHLRFCEQEWFESYILTNAESFAAIKDDPEIDKKKLFIIPQAQLENWRVDFLIYAFADWAREPGGGVMGWNSLIVECDGHDFHERTKEQAAKDRERDRSAQLKGIEVFRFTGSELWRDPLKCAEQVIAWANRRV